jgi:short-subunit dehydrogenase involved in D-alanine esterification of teichoic acids
MTQRNDKKPNSVITGGGSGIGEAFALKLATNIQVVICRQNKEKQKQEGKKWPCLLQNGEFSRLPFH